MYFVYLLECEDKSLYTGITNDLERRLKEHKNGIGGHYTSSHRAVKMVHTEKFKTRSGALKREAEIKGWRREDKLALYLTKRRISALLQSSKSTDFFQLNTKGSTDER